MLKTWKFLKGDGPEVRQYSSNLDRFFPLQNGISTMNNGRMYDYVQGNYYDLYKYYCGLAKSCIDVRANNLARAEIRIYEKKNQTDEKELDDNDLIKIFDNNPTFTLQQMLTLLCKNIDIVGNSYWKIVRYGKKGEAFEFWPLITPFNNTMTPIISNGVIVQYEYRDVFNNQTITYDANDIIHIKEINPVMPYLGIGKISSNPYIFEMERNLSIYQKNFLKNDAVGKAYIKILSDTHEMNTEEFLEKFQRDFEGPYNAGLMPALANAEIIPLSTSPKDMDYPKMEDIIDRKTLATFTMHPLILGTVPAVQYAAAGAAIDMFYNLHLNPLKDMIAGTLTQFARKEFENPKLLVKLVLEKPQDSELELKKIQMQIDTSSITHNEIRAINSSDPVKGPYGEEFVKVTTQTQTVQSEGKEKDKGAE